MGWIFNLRAIQIWCIKRIFLSDKPIKITSYLWIWLWWYIYLGLSNNYSVIIIHMAATFINASNTLCLSDIIYSENNWWRSIIRHIFLSMSVTHWNFWIKSSQLYICIWAHAYKCLSEGYCICGMTCGGM